MERDGKMGVQLDVSNGYAGRLEVVEGPTGRRQRSAPERAQIADNCSRPVPFGT